MYTSICDACLSYARKQMGSHNNNSNDNDEKNECVDNGANIVTCISKNLIVHQYHF